MYYSTCENCLSPSHGSQFCCAECRDEYYNGKSKTKPHVKPKKMSEEEISAKITEWKKVINKGTEQRFAGCTMIVTELTEAGCYGTTTKQCGREENVNVEYRISYNEKDDCVEGTIIRL